MPLLVDEIKMAQKCFYCFGGPLEGGKMIVPAETELRREVSLHMTDWVCMFNAPSLKAEITAG